MMPRKVKSTADTFIFHGAGSHTLSGFDPSEDRVMFDIGGTYSDILYLGQLHDGLSFAAGPATFTISAGDFNHDGIGDTRIDGFVGDQHSIVDLLSVSPDQLYGWNLMGG